MRVLLLVGSYMQYTMFLLILISGIKCRTCKLLRPIILWRGVSVSYKTAARIKVLFGADTPGGKEVDEGRTGVPNASTDSAVFATVFLLAYNI